MKNRILLLTAAWLSVGLLYAQEVDEIITKYLDAMGGIEQLRNWETLKATGSYVMLTQGGKEVPFTTWYKAPVKKRVDMIVEGDTAIYSFDGETSWFCDPSRGVHIPMIMPEQQAKNNKDNADEYAFIDYKNKGHKVEFLRTEKLNDKDVDVIKLIRNNGSESYHFIECDSGHEVKIILQSKINSSIITTEILESDFRKIDWLLLPFSVETRINEKPVYKLLIDKAEINIPVSDSLFIFPSNK